MVHDHPNIGVLVHDAMCVIVVSFLEMYKLKFLKRLYIQKILIKGLQELQIIDLPIFYGFILANATG
ncbi:hypothetical protein C1H46_023289 [Malus baccata]|uniref:Uncharacterized protein n=1 Tax=Malus baccata TaxID=106549 RepID=A0A540LXA6_MALBA|nr:hypothetical protein C1H46_023289 [Malus baccata]